MVAGADHAVIARGRRTRDRRASIRGVLVVLVVLGLLQRAPELGRLRLVRVRRGRIRGGRLLVAGIGAAGGGRGGVVVRVRVGPAEDVLDQIIVRHRVRTCGSQRRARLCGERGRFARGGERCGATEGRVVARARRGWRHLSHPHAWNTFF